MGESGQGSGSLQHADIQITGATRYSPSSSSGDVGDMEDTGTTHCNALLIVLYIMYYTCVHYVEIFCLG